MANPNSKISYAADTRVDTASIDPTSAAHSTPPGPVRSPWLRPRLECLGDVRQLTMGATRGNAESGQAFTFHT
jgi:hypothetical protein